MFNLLNVRKNGNSKEFTLSGSLIVLFLASQKCHSHTKTIWTSVIAILWMTKILLFQVRQLPNFWRQYRYLVTIQFQTWNKCYKYFDWKQYYLVNLVNFPISRGTIVIRLLERLKLPELWAKRQQKNTTYALRFSKSQISSRIFVRLLSLRRILQWVSPQTTLLS